MSAVIAVVADAGVDPGGAYALPGGVRRTRVELWRDGVRLPVVDEHVRAGASAPAPWPSLADVLMGPGEGAYDADGLAAGHPGALVVAVYRGPRCWLRLGPDGPVLALRAPRCPAPWAYVASAAHAWLVAGMRPALLGAAGMPAISAAGEETCVLPAPEPVAQPASSTSRPSRSRAVSASDEPERPAAE